MVNADAATAKATRGLLNMAERVATRGAERVATRGRVLVIIVLNIVVLFGVS